MPPTQPPLEEIYRLGIVWFSQVIFTPVEGYSKMLGGHGRFLADLERVCAIAAGKQPPDFERKQSG